jgi:predicted alpha/beta-hydrolase family hydrolase
VTDPATPPLLFDGPDDAPATVALAHGAGAPMDSAFMNVVARGLAERGLRVARFEFPYMRRRREGGRRGIPDPPKVLEATWLEVVAALDPSRLVIGGKSMGGRIASMVADRAGVRGLVCLGYPFHPPRQPSKLRTAHLVDLRTPALVVQGTRDEFGSREEVSGYALSPAIRLLWLEGGDHSYKPAKGSGATARQHVETAIDAVARFVAERVASTSA